MITLSHPWPRMAAEAKKRAEHCLETHDSYLGGCETATFKRRLIAGRVTIHMQCDQCGKSLSGAFARETIYNWQTALRNQAGGILPWR